MDLFPKSIEPGSTAAIRTALSSTSQVSDRIKGLQRIVGRVVAIEEREVLSNGLGEIGEAYEEGWQSDSDESEDLFRELPKCPIHRRIVTSSAKRSI